MSKSERLPIGQSTGAERLALRHLLSTTLGNSTGAEALDFVQGVLGRRVMVVAMSSAEIDVVRRALEARATRG